MERERLISRFDLYALPFFLGLAVLFVFALWPWKLWVVLGVGLIGSLLGSVRLYMIWENHRVDILTKRNRAMVVHEGPEGFGYLRDGQVQVHTIGAGVVPALPPGDMYEEPYYEDVPADYPRDFNELMGAGYLGMGADFVFGFDKLTGDPVRLDTMSSIGISGKSGFGKTVLTTLICLEAVAKYSGKVRFLVSDPHMYVDEDQALAKKIESLRPYFLTIDDIRRTVPADDYEYHQLLTRMSSLPNPCVGGEEVIAWMKIVEMEMKRRARGKKGELWVVVMDEFIEIMSNREASTAVGSILSKLNQQARKMHMFCMLVSQDWKASLVGGTDIRNSISTFMVLNSAESIAQMLLPNGEAAKAPTLDRGEALAHVRGRTTLVSIPDTTVDDAETFVSLYGPSPVMHQEVLSSAPAAPTEVLELPPEPEPEQAAYVELPGDFSFQETEDIRAGYLEGLGEGDIAKKVYGVRSGPELASAKIRVNTCIKWLLQQTMIARRQ